MNEIAGYTGLGFAVLLLVFLVVKTKVHPVIAMVMAACIAGISAGMGTDKTLEAITRGFGNTLSSIGLVIGLGVMMGRILEVSGAAEKMALTFIKWLGKNNESWALALTGFLVSIPIFADSAFIVLYPIAKAVSKAGKKSIISLSIALAGGLVVTHSLVPPTPGPLAVAGLFGVDLGKMMMAGMLLAIPCVIIIVLYAQWLGIKYPEYVKEEMPVNKTVDFKTLPTLWKSVLPIMIPVFLIFSKAICGLFLSGAELLNTRVDFFLSIIDFLGNPVIALIISTLLAVYLLVPQLNRKEVAARLEEGLTSAGIILLVTGAGGALGFVVRESGMGDRLATMVTGLPLSPVMLPFFVASAVRLIQGSGTVAMITAASLTAPILLEIPGLNLLFAALSAVTGSMLFSYFNDSLFWVFNRMVGNLELKKQILSWSIPTTLAWAMGGILVASGNLLFGNKGLLADLLIPTSVLVILYFFLRKINFKEEFNHSDLP